MGTIALTVKRNNGKNPPLPEAVSSFTFFEEIIHRIQIQIHRETPNK